MTGFQSLVNMLSQQWVIRNTQNHSDISQTHENGNNKNALANTTDSENVEPLYEGLCWTFLEEM